MLKAMGTPINIMTTMIPRHINPGKSPIVYINSALYRHLRTSGVMSLVTEQLSNDSDELAYQHNAQERIADGNRSLTGHKGSAQDE